MQAVRLLFVAPRRGRVRARRRCPSPAPARCWCARCTRGSAPAPSCSPTAACSTRTSRSTSGSGRSAAPSATRSPTATAAWARSSARPARFPRGRWSSRSIRTRTGSWSARTTSSRCPRAPTRARPRCSRYVETGLQLSLDAGPGGARDRRRAGSRRGRRASPPCCCSGPARPCSPPIRRPSAGSWPASLGIPAVEPGGAAVPPAVRRRAAAARAVRLAHRARRGAGPAGARGHRAGGLLVRPSSRSSCRSAARSTGAG